MAKRIIIGDGKVSKIIRKPGDIILDHKQVDITKIDSLYKALDPHLNGWVTDDTVINTAAKINLEWCDENRLESYNVNTQGAINVLAACRFFGARLVQISSGCIFDGNHVPFREDDVPRPAAWYARTKAWADDAIVNYGYSNYLILRPRQMISPVPNPTNMLTKFLKIKNLQCIDEANSITCIEDFRDMLDHLLKVKALGIFNCANTGSVSPYEVACALKAIDPSMQVSKIAYEEYIKTLTVKRVNTVQDLTKLIASGFVPRSGQEALQWCIKNYGKTQ